MKRLVLAQAAAEMVPFAKVGGLADVVGTLPKFFAREGVTIYSFLPAYSQVKTKWLPKCRLFKRISVVINGRRESAGIYCLGREKFHTVFFVDHPRYFDRKEIYGTPSGDYRDNWARFAFFSSAVFEALTDERLKAVDVIHAHDWQAALLPVLLKERYAIHPRFKNTRSILTAHNLAYQGVFDAKVLPRVGLSRFLSRDELMGFWGKINYLKGGLVYADKITTVSPTYTLEIQKTEHGAGLDSVLRLRKKNLVGIMNGIHPKMWNPGTDPLIRKKFSAGSLNGKAFNKKCLQEENRLEVQNAAMLIGMVSRIVEQKGLDILIPVIPKIMKLPVQLVILGTGERRYEEKLNKIARAYPGKISFSSGFNERLAHRIYAGSDAFLMPSRFEPCGLGQLIGYRYGVIPIVRQTGGLKDTVLDYSKKTGRGTGFTFRAYSPEALYQTVWRAVQFFDDGTVWKNLVRRVMLLDHSWTKPALDYLKLFKKNA